MLCTFVYLYRFLFFLNSAWFAETSENPDHRKSDMQTDRSAQRIENPDKG